MTGILTPSPSLGTPVGFRLRQRWVLFAMFMAPVLFVAGQAVLPVLPQEFTGAFEGMIEHRDALLASRLLTAAGAFLFVPAIVGIWSLVPRRGKGWRCCLLGGIVFAVGTWLNGLSEAVLGYSTHAATAVAPDEGSSVVLALDNLGPIGLPISYYVVFVVGVGLLLLSIGLLGVRSMPFWQPLLLILGTLLAFAFAGMGLISLLTGLPLIAAFWGMGVSVARHVNKDSGQVRHDP